MIRICLDSQRFFRVIYLERNNFGVSIPTTPSMKTLPCIEDAYDAWGIKVLVTTSQEIGKERRQFVADH